ncbi:ecto-ADP-ribosyltransferase 5-like [Hippoglossus stenolepis]|uniref:ecto-ADP-ribosyltransferase 5-like n=1 Tax=Hippoglossus stenolepis TaxID=195615 RepID=UPI00159C6097|nr:ecto-ADP-ribosyltransferase 5-like [Hippoglossus stenolepis]
MMKGNMLIFASLCGLLCWNHVDSMRIHFKSLPMEVNQRRDNIILKEVDQSSNIPLNMVEESVDDMYFGCNELMMRMVKSKYFEEKYVNKTFENAWNEAEKCAEERIARLEDEGLTKDHLRAICVYTYDEIYSVFNNAVRIKRNNYRSSFQFHYLHFMLTSAVQILNNNNYCHTTYRRNSERFTGQINHIIRFGSFASSSYKPYLVRFGNETCFKIKTCSGAFLKHYTFYNYEDEVEVLIPPYEMFNITEIVKDNSKIRDMGLTSCKVVYVLESAGFKSNLNCKVVNK